MLVSLMSFLFCPTRSVSLKTVLPDETFNGENWTNVNLYTLRCVRSNGIFNMLCGNHAIHLQAVSMAPC